MKVTQGQLKNCVPNMLMHRPEPMLVMVLETKYGYGWVKVIEVATGKQHSVKIMWLEETWRRG